MAWPSDFDHVGAFVPRGSCYPSRRKMQLQHSNLKPGWYWTRYKDEETDEIVGVWWLRSGDLGIFRAGYEGIFRFEDFVTFDLTPITAQLPLPSSQRGYKSECSES